MKKLKVAREELDKELVKDATEEKRLEVRFIPFGHNHS
jgi:hypothetical protein